MAKQTYKKHLNKNNKSNNYKGNNSKKENVKIEAINYTEGITVGELANKINRNSGEIIKLLFMLGKVLTINSPLDDENVELICMEWGITAWTWRT